MSGPATNDQDCATDGRSDDRHPWSVYVQCFFVSVATVLGTGILGLPVKLARSGLSPFFLTFSFCFLIQMVVVAYFADIIQRCQARLDLEQAEAGTEAMPLVNPADDELGVEDDEDEEEMVQPVARAQEGQPLERPSLTLLARFFLPRYLVAVFNVLILVGFVAIMISYCLAAGKEFALLLHLTQSLVTGTFGLGLGLFAIFGFWIVQPIISVLTFAKASILIAVVAVTFLVGAQVHVAVANDYSELMEPLLMSSLALGGAVNVMPMLFGLLPEPSSRRQVAGFRAAVELGVAACYLLNLAWCWSVLNIVPQTCAAPAANTCVASLSGAEQHGQPSTIPLKQIILEERPDFAWVAIFIQIFIIVSISVSFLTHSAAFSHTVEGLIVHLFRTHDAPRCCVARPLLSERAVTRIVAVLGLVVIVGFAMLRPDSFIVVLERLGSLVLNLECGPFLFMMIVMSNTSRNRSLHVPLPLSRWFHVCALVVLLFGLFSLAFDMYGFIDSFFVGRRANATAATPTPIPAQ